jgi:hypothetical protein
VPQFAFLITERVVRSVPITFDGMALFEPRGEAVMIEKIACVGIGLVQIGGVVLREVSSVQGFGEFSLAGTLEEYGLRLVCGLIYALEPFEVFDCAGKSGIFVRCTFHAMSALFVLLSIAFEVASMPGLEISSFLRSSEPEAAIYAAILLNSLFRIGSLVAPQGTKDEPQI